MATAEIAEINSNIRSALGESAGTFRKAANDNTALMSRVAKDISNVFDKQKSQIASLNDNIEEVAQHSEQSSMKLDKIFSVLSDSVAAQNQMVSHMRNMVDGVYTSNKSLFSLQNSMGDAGGSGMLGMLGNFLGKIGTVITAIEGIGTAVSLAVGGAGAAKILYDQTAGSGASGATGPVTDSSVGKGGKQFQEITPRLAADLKKDFPNMSKEDIAAIIGNLGEESGGFSQMSEAGGKGPGRGWAQWTSPDRKAKFMSNVQKHGGDLANYQANYETLKDELKGQYASAVKEMMAAQGLTNKTHVFMKKFENPGVEHFDVRMRYSQRAMNATSAAATEVPANNNEARGHDAQKVENKGEHHDAHGSIISGAEKQIKEDSTALAGKSTSGVNSELISKLTKAASEYKQKTGQTVNVTSGFRSKQKQQELYEAYKSGRSNIPANPPGNSNHETGNAIDISQDQARAMEQMGILAKHGLARPLGERDPVHIQLAGTGTNQSSYGKSSGSSGETSEKETTGSSGGPDASPASGGQAETPAASPLDSAHFAAITGGSSYDEMKQEIEKYMAGGIPGAMQPAMGGSPMNMLGSMGGMMGGAGSMLGMLSPLLGGLTTEAAAPTGEMLQSMSQATQTSELKKQAVVREAQNQISTEIATQTATDKAVEDNNLRNSNRNEGRPIMSDYNRPEDKGWPEWLGGFGTGVYDEFIKHTGGIRRS